LILPRRGPSTPRRRPPPHRRRGLLSVVVADLLLDLGVPLGVVLVEDVLVPVDEPLHDGGSAGKDGAEPGLPGPVRDLVGEDWHGPAASGALHQHEVDDLLVHLHQPGSHSSSAGTR
jgi:hypothetical protein